MDTMAERWRRLAPHIEQLTPEGAGPFPTVLIFHGCGGVRDHLRAYARAAVKAGWGAVLVDSFGARGWSRRFAQYLVCTGLLLRGRERAGDVLAALHGVRDWPQVDGRRLVLAGWSHGAWAIMDLMAQPLRSAGEVGIADSARVGLSGLVGGFMAYPYVGVASASRGRPWPRRLPLFAIVPRRDHLATVRRHMKALTSAVASGSDVEVWSVDATHAFDEPGLASSLMRHDPALGEEALRRFQRFLSARQASA